MTVAMNHAAGVHSARRRRVLGALDQAGAVVAMAVMAAMCAVTAVEQQAVDGERGAESNGGNRARGDGRLFETATAETMIAGYGGFAYTYPSDVRFTDAGKGTDFTLKKVGWDAKPFRHPVYYGVRVARWSPGSRQGVMVDFLHSKAISRPDDRLKVEGRIDGKPAPQETQVKDLFRTLEFSHGHNMVMLTGLFRLGALTPRLAPYAGLGVGVSLPHTEVKRHSEEKRTYEYQYAGPVGQGLVGLELRLKGASVFVEYKFTLADYRVPMTWRDGDLLVTDVWRQLGEWWAGKTPPGGWAATRLTSHNFIAGAGPRLTSP